MIQLEQSRPGTPPTDGVTGPQIVSPQLKDQFEILRSLLQRSLWLAEKLGDNEATQILRARMANLKAAALMVVVGEVKVGKSSFINALLRDEVCAVAPEPCTASIQELVFGPQREVTTLGQAWDRVYLPKEVLREISIVDTPGTNSIVRDHSTITQNYIPHSDLIVFVFSAANPHTQTAWELLTLIKKEWHRKMVFVLQQADRASERELTANREHVKQYARERQVVNPVVFTLSAQRELAGYADSGFAEFRRFLRYGIERGEVWRTKFEGSYSTIRTVMTKLLTNLRVERATLAEERSFYQGLLKKVEETEARAGALQQSIVGRLSANYDRAAAASERQLVEGLRMGEILKTAVPLPLKKAAEPTAGREATLAHDAAANETAIVTPDVAKHLFSEMESMMKELIENVARRQEVGRANGHLPQTDSRLAMLQRLRARLESQRVSDLVSVHAAVAADVRKYAVGGIVVAALGLAAIVLGQLLWMRVAGGVIAAIGLVLLASGMLRRTSDAARVARQKLGDSRKEFRRRLETEIGQIFGGILNDVRADLQETIARLDFQHSHVETLLEETFQIGEAASEMVMLSHKIQVAPDRGAA